MELSTTGIITFEPPEAEPPLIAMLIPDVPPSGITYGHVGLAERAGTKIFTRNKKYLFLY